MDFTRAIKEHKLFLTSVLPNLRLLALPLKEIVGLNSWGEGLLLADLRWEDMLFTLNKSGRAGVWYGTDPAVCWQTKMCTQRWIIVRTHTAKARHKIYWPLIKSSSDISKQM